MSRHWPIVRLFSPSLLACFVVVGLDILCFVTKRDISAKIDAFQFQGEGKMRCCEFMNQWKSLQSMNILLPLWINWHEHLMVIGLILSRQNGKWSKSSWIKWQTNRFLEKLEENSKCDEVASETAFNTSFWGQGAYMNVNICPTKHSHSHLT